jgi:hypothetical protein
MTHTVILGAQKAKIERITVPGQTFRDPISTNKQGISVIPPMREVLCRKDQSLRLAWGKNTRTYLKNN